MFLNIVVPLRFLRAALVALATLGLTAAAEATPITFTANLSGANENPPNASTATGFGTFVLDSAAQTLNITVSFSGLREVVPVV
jgi:hypothetical protein